MQPEFSLELDFGQSLHFPTTFDDRLASLTDASNSKNANIPFLNHSISISSIIISLSHFNSEIKMSALLAINVTSHSKK